MNIKEIYDHLGNLLAQGIDPDTPILVVRGDEQVVDETLWNTFVTEAVTACTGYYEYIQQVPNGQPFNRPFTGLGILLLAQWQTDHEYLQPSTPIYQPYRPDRTEVIKGSGILDPHYTPIGDK